MQDTELQLLDDVAFCLSCGGAMTFAKWQDRGKAVLKICSQNHLWEAYKTGESFQLRRLPLFRCACGEVLPDHEMREINQQRLCPKCFEAARKAWRMDKDKSFARLEIIPIRTSERLYWQLHTAIKIEPYPNPFMYGGMWGGGSAKDEQELEYAIKAFEDQVARLKENGMEKVEIVRHDERTRTEQMGLNGGTSLIQAREREKRGDRSQVVKPPKPAPTPQPKLF